MADKRISQLIERVTIANNDVLPIVASGATTTNKVTVSTLQDWMQNNLDVGVTSIGITIGSSGTDINVTGSPVTTSGNITINIPTASATNRGLLSSSDWTTFNNKLSSVGLSMPSAFTVSNSPLTANGTITVTGAGTVAQYIRGDGSLADFPEAGGGGASVSYYLNGSVSQGTIGGIAYYEMNKTPILGAGTDFTIAADGYIASFITDAGDPSLLEIPGGNWNFESYFQASSGGGSPSFYIELYKVNSGGTATLIASNSANPELIAFGTTTTAYFSTLAVPTTTLALTDRLAVRFYVTHSGRTITMHTENSNLCQVITTFTTGLTALNGLTAQVQNFATGTSGTDFAISSAGSTHTFNLPDASATARGVVSTNSQVFTGVKTFSNGLSLPAVGGSNQTTRLVNIGTIHEGSAGSNQIGFNNSNNIYFGKGLSDGGVITWSNSEVRSYTLPNVSGVIALTTNIPANPVGGSGTINQIPKYTSSTTTIGNSNISDNGSDVVISSRTGISLSGQSILITPNLGGTTNRIETTGSLPLAIATSGSSITLAAGGTTPQITLATTGAVTFSSGFVSFGNNGYIRNDSSGWLQLQGGSNGTRIMNAGNSSAYLSIAESTGAATFSSSVNLGTNANSADTALLNIKQSGTSYNNGIYIERGGERNGYHMYIGGALDSLTFRRNYFGTQSDVMSLTRDGNVGIGTTSPNRQLTISAPQAVMSFNATSYRNTTIGSDATGSFIVYDDTAAAYRMVITSGGNVGIGTDSPANYSNYTTQTINGTNGGILQLQSSGTASLRLIGEGTDAYIDNLTSGGALLFRTNNATERMRITSGGRVGIGTTSPNVALHISGVNEASGFDITNTTASTGKTFRIASQSTGNLVFEDITASAERMRITSGGAVSIGSTSTNGRLGVRGTTNDSSAYAFEAANSSGNSLFLVRNDGFVGVNTVPAARFEVKQGGSEIPMIIDSSSDSFGAYTQYQVNNSGGWEVGMSRAADGYKYLFSYGEFNTTNTKVAITNTGDFIVGKASFVSNSLRIDANGILSNSRGGTGTNSHCNFFNDNGLVGSITTSGSSTSYNTSSDYRLKENVKPVENALSVLTQLKPCTFNFIADADEEVMGFIAHEVQEVIPQAVIGQKDEVRIEQVEVSPAELDEEGNVITEAVIEEKEVPVYQGIDHSKLVPLLVAAIQEQQEQIKSLTEQVDSLKNQIK